MLAFHFLNVGHGDSTVVQFVDPNGNQHFGVIDSNKKGAETPSALRKLRQLGAQRLSFLALTHPHADHYKGLSEILDEFEGAIDEVYLFPIDRARDRHKKWLTQYFAAIEASDDETSVRAVEELVTIFCAIESHPSVSELSGYGQVVYAPGMEAVDIRNMLPPSKVKGEFFKAIDEGRSLLAHERNNSLSLAFEFNYAGRTVVVGGDGTHLNWLDTRKRYPKEQGVEFGSPVANVVKLPHHGSRVDSPDIVLNFLFGTPAADKAIAIVSADGRSHPDPTVLQSLEARGIAPYCTNLSKHCSGRLSSENVVSNTVDETLVRFLRSVAMPSSRPQACQGDITVKISPAGDVSVERQFENACPLRGELELMLI